VEWKNKVAIIEIGTERRYPSVSAGIIWRESDNYGQNEKKKISSLGEKLGTENDKGMGQRRQENEEIEEGRVVFQKIPEMPQEDS